MGTQAQSLGDGTVAGSGEGATAQPNRGLEVPYR